jgi:hypothetical protein
VTQGEDRRTSERVRLSLPVQYSLNGGTLRSGRVENVSQGGVLLVVDETLSDGAVLELVFSDPRSGIRHKVGGTVVRSATLRSFGISFVQVHETLLDYIRHIPEGVAG